METIGCMHQPKGMDIMSQVFLYHRVTMLFFSFVNLLSDESMFVAEG